MNRRTVLRRLGVAGTGIAALAGCSSPQGGEGTTDGPVVDTETPTETPTETATGTDAGAGAGTGTPAGSPTGTDTGTGTATDTGTGGGTNSFEFTGVVQGWQGESPENIANQQNPPIQLQAGQQYEVTWTNGDGVPHDFTIQDSDGNNLEQSQQLSSEGASTTLTFTATEEMAQYICTIHPNTMIGNVEMGG